MWVLVLPDGQIIDTAQVPFEFHKSCKWFKIDEEATIGDSFTDGKITKQQIRDKIQTRNKRNILEDIIVELMNVHAQLKSSRYNNIRKLKDKYEALKS